MLKPNAKQLEELETYNDPLFLYMILYLLYFKLLYFLL